MNIFNTKIFLILIAMLNSLQAEIVNGIDAFFRDGQVFITWNEQADNYNNLSVYSSNEPINPSNLNDATLLTANLEPHSANDWLEDPDLCPKAEGQRRGWILDSFSEPLDPTGGLFVHTPTEDGSLYFAVLPEGQLPQQLAFGINSTSKPIKVRVEPISAIYQLRKRFTPPQSGKALAISLHSHQSRPKGEFTHLFFGDSTMGWREGLPFKFKVSVLSDVILIEPYDRVWINRRLGEDETYIPYNRQYKNIETWWYGTNDKIYEPDKQLRLKGTPTNYTERILMWMIDWVEKTYRTDPDRVYAFGASMGSGVQRLVMQNPDRFASVDVLVPFVDFAYEQGNQSNAKRFTACCTSVDLICSDGMPLRQRLDLVDFVKNTKRDLPPVVIRVGRQDKSVYWRRKPDYVRAMNENAHSLFAAWDDGTHSTAMRYSVDGFPKFMEYKWFIDRFATNKSFPAITNYSLNEDIGNGDEDNGDTIGFINRGIDWSVVEDLPMRYKLHIKITHPEAVYPVYLDITPRRRQNFLPKAGDKVLAVRMNADGDLKDKRIITVDDYGMFTYKDLSVNSQQDVFLEFEIF